MFSSSEAEAACSVRLTHDAGRSSDHTDSPLWSVVLFIPFIFVVYLKACLHVTMVSRKHWGQKCYKDAADTVHRGFVLLLFLETLTVDYSRVIYFVVFICHTLKATRGWGPLMQTCCFQAEAANIYHS